MYHLQSVSLYHRTSLWIDVRLPQDRIETQPTWHQLGIFPFDLSAPGREESELLCIYFRINTPVIQRRVLASAVAVTSCYLT